MPEEPLDSGQPTSTPKETGGDSKSSSDSAAQLQATLEKLNSRLEEVDKRTRTLQSDKDRGISKTQKEIEELKQKFAQIDNLKKRGLTEDEAFEELQLREAITQIRQQQLVANQGLSDEGTGTTNTLSVEKAKTLQQYGLSENDLDVAAEFSSKEFYTPLELENAALRIAFKRTQKPAPDAAAATSPAGGGGMGTGNPVQSDINRYEQLSKSPTANAAELKALKQKLDAANWGES